jgi:hypothetical protein
MTITIEITKEQEDIIAKKTPLATFEAELLGYARGPADY